MRPEPHTENYRKPWTAGVGETVFHREGHSSWLGSGQQANKSFQHVPLGPTHSLNTNLTPYTQVNSRGAQTQSHEAGKHRNGF